MNWECFLNSRILFKVGCITQRGCGNKFKEVQLKSIKIKTNLCNC